MNSHKVNYDGISMDPSSDSELQHIKNPTSVMNRRVCLICGADAIGINFNVATVSTYLFFSSKPFCFHYLVYFMQSLFSTKWFQTIGT